MKLTEKDLQTYGTQLLEMDGWRHLRTDPVSDRATVQTIRRKVANHPALNGLIEIIMRVVDSCVRGKGFGEVGMADYMYIRYRWTPQLIEGDIRGLVLVELVWIEWKRNGGKPTKAQLAWHEAERKREALTLIAGLDFEATPEGFYGWYKQSGLMRKAISPPKGATM